jgi:hypothetical protein
MDEPNTFKIGTNPVTAAQTPEASAPQAAPAPVASSPQVTPLPASPAQATQVPQPIASAPQPTPPVINNKLNVQLDKSVDTQLSRLGGAESKILSTKSYLVIGILIIALAAAAYGAYIFFFAEESATEENSEGIPLTNKLGGSENLEGTTGKISSPPSLTINLPEEDTSETDDSTDTADTPENPVDEATDTNTPAATDSKIPR